jgi:hypothetical protein
MFDKNYKYPTILLLSFILISCEKSPYLSSELDCDHQNYTDLKTYHDINKNFKLDIPSIWKTELYFSDYESEIFAADTTQQLTESYILDASYNSGRLNFDEVFYKNTDSISRLNNLSILNSGNESFQKKSTYWNILKGTKNRYPYHQFNLMVKLSRNSYFKGYSEIYGDSAVYVRICKSISIFESIEFLE